MKTTRIITGLFLVSALSVGTLAYFIIDKPENNDKQNKEILTILRGIRSFANKPEPQAFVVIDPTKASNPAFPSDWATTWPNDSAITVQYKVGSDKRYLVDICLIHNSFGHNTEKEVDKWLSTNDRHINFTESATLIEAAHIILERDDLKTINKQKTAGATFKAPATDIIALAQSAPMKDQFDDYIKITKTTTAGVVVYTPSTEGTFDKDLALFSAPLINSIVQNRGASVRFRFSEIYFRGRDEVIIMEAVDSSNNNAHIAYYDFTHRPDL